MQVKKGMRLRIIFRMQFPICLERYIVQLWMQMYLEQWAHGMTNPPYYAQEKGLQKEYNSLSNKLLEQLRYNLLYVVNEGWII